MLHEVLNAFEGVKLDIFYEGTLGAGGHAKAILEAHPEIRCYFACDKDPEAIEIARKALALWEDKVELIHGDFAHLGLQMEERGVAEVDGFFLT
jgi:16S rRNA (cytosine1402-N4)-methyltransferase